MARLSTASENTMVSSVIVPSTTYYLALNTGDPGQTGANEVTGGSYARQSIAFGAASGGIELSTTAQTFAGMPAEAGGCPYASIWDSSSSGNFLWGGPTSGLSAAIEAGATVTFAIGNVSVAVS